MRTATLVGALVVATALLFVVPSGITYGPTRGGTSGTAPVVSWNLPSLEKYHAPLSSVAAVALKGVVPRPDLAAGSAPVSAPGPNGGVSSVPVNAVRFIDDPSYIAQSETTIAVGPNDPSHVVGAFNDARWFFCPALPARACPAGFEVSLSGFTVSIDGGKTVLKTGDLPGIANPRTAGILASWGDPSLAVGVDGTFYYASLAIDPNTAANGIELSKSNDSALFSRTISCATPIATPTSNPCWTSTFVWGNRTANATSFEDKELIAIDRDPTSPFFKDIYIAWDHFYATGTSSTYLSRCTPGLACTILSGGPVPVLSGSDPFVAFSTPTVGTNGAVHVAWCNYGTATTLGPITCRVRSTAANGGVLLGTHVIYSFDGAGTIAPKAGGLVGFATEQFRTANIGVIAADSSGITNNLYWTIDVCTQGNYYNFFSPAIPGNCGLSATVFTRSTDGGKTWSAPVYLSHPAVNIQSWVTVDASNGAVVVSWYTTQYDPFNHRIDVVSAVSKDNGSTFPTFLRETSTSNEPNADPVMYDYTVGGGFGGSFVVPQFGDYFQSVAVNGQIYTLFTGNYAAEVGAFQADPWLVTSGEHH